MTVIRNFPTEKYIGNRRVVTSQSAIISDNVYTTTGEDCLIVKKVDHCKIKLDSITTDRVVIKSFTKVLVIPDKGLIDEKFDEVFIGPDASVEFVYCVDNWYIISSDGLKMD